MLRQTVQVFNIPLDKLWGSMMVLQQSYNFAFNEAPCTTEAEEDRKDESDDGINNKVYEVPDGADFRLEARFLDFFDWSFRSSGRGGWWCG